jgi:hypothetical protein
MKSFTEKEVGVHLHHAHFELNADLMFAGFKRGGIEMSHHHFAPRKTVPPRASSRDPSPEHLRYDSSSELGDKEPAVEMVDTSPFDDKNAVHV